MNRSSDLLISRLLKSWAGRYQPPANARARLLWDAAHQTAGIPRKFSLFNRPPSYHHPLSSPDEWSRTLFFWIDEHTYQVGLQVRLT